MEIFHIVIIGIVSCLAMDMWQRLLKLLYDINPSDWGVVGRWFVLVVFRGKIYNPTIDEEVSIKNELMIGWIVHYSVAILYSVFFFMPVLGKGFLGIKTPSPFLACSLAVGSHIAIGASIGGFYQIFGY